MYQRGGLAAAGWRQYAGEAATRTDRFIPLKENDATSLVSSGEIISRVVEFDGGDDVGCEVGHEDRMMK